MNIRHSHDNGVWLLRGFDHTYFSWVELYPNAPIYTPLHHFSSKEEGTRLYGLLISDRINLHKKAGISRYYQLINFWVLLAFKSALFVKRIDHYFVYDINGGATVLMENVKRTLIL